MKKVISILLVLVMAFTLAPLAFASEEAVTDEPETIGEEITEEEPAEAPALDGVTYSGECGNNVSWSLDTSTGAMTISGTGDMDDYYSYSGGNQPWYPYHEMIRSVVIKSGVTSIGEYAFYVCQNLTSVTIADSVTEVRRFAFSGCDLQSVRLSASLTTIAEGSFEYNLQLANLTIPYGVTVIEEDAFADCGLTDITIPNSVTTIEKCAFSFCKMTSVTIPEGVTTIESEAFINCFYLKNVTIPDSVTSIGECAFGYSNRDVDYHEKIVEDLTITASSGSAGEKYAKENGFTFIKDTSIPIDAKHFPDATFRFYLSRDVDKDGSGTLSPDEIAARKLLDLAGDEELYDVEGIRYLTALEELNVNECGLTWLDAGSNNNLRSLSCFGNGIDTLYVGNCTDLEEIDCSENELDELELVDNVNLVRLVMDQNLFRRLDISNCPKLRLLRCNGNQLTELDVSQNPLLLAAVQAGAHTTDYGNVMYYLKDEAGDPVITTVRENGKDVKVSALLITDPGVKIITEAEVTEPAKVTIAEDGKTARASGGYEGLYARVALVLDNGGVSGLYVTQATINEDGTIVIPAFMVPGLKVKGVNVSLVPTLSDIQSSSPKVEATASKML